MPEVELARMRMALGMAVEELAEEGTARSLDLGDEDQRLAHVDAMLGAELAEQGVLVHYPSERSTARS